MGEDWCILITFLTGFASFIVGIIFLVVGIVVMIDALA